MRRQALLALANVWTRKKKKNLDRCAALLALTMYHATAATGAATGAATLHILRLLCGAARSVCVYVIRIRMCVYMYTIHGFFTMKVVSEYRQVFCANRKTVTVSCC